MAAHAFETKAALKIQKLDRVSIAVKNLDEACSYYGNLLGTHFDKLEVDISPGAHVTVGVSPMGIELVEQNSPRTGQEGIRSIVLKTENIRDTAEEMKAKGFEPVGRVDAGDLKEVVYNVRGVRLAFAEYDEAKVGTHAIVNAVKVNER